jgi:hypothetical protein
LRPAVPAVSGKIGEQDLGTVQRIDRDGALATHDDAIARLRLLAVDLDATARSDQVHLTARAQRTQDALAGGERRAEQRCILINRQSAVIAFAP